jgi:hypothetical protein
MIARNLLIPVLVALALSPVVTVARDWEDLREGDIVTFLIPLDSPQPILSPTSDTVVLTGGKVLGIVIVGCGTGTHAVQHYTIIDATGKRSARSGGIIAVTIGNPIRPGTRLGQLTFDTQCSINGVEYVKYQGTVE